MSKTFIQLSKAFLRFGKKLGMKVSTLSNGAPVLYKPGNKVFSIISGIHGDEKAGPLFLYQLLKTLVKNKDSIPDGLLIIPLVNNIGWDYNSRFYKEWKEDYFGPDIDLNRQFKKDTEIKLIQEIMNIYRDKPIVLHWDIHEDDSRNYEYVFGFSGNSDLSKELAQYLECWLEIWVQFDGSSESFLIDLFDRQVSSLTTETPPIWELAQRIEWNKKVFDWLLNRFVHHNAYQLLS